MRKKVLSFLVTIAMVTSLFGGLSITAFATGEHWTDGVTSDTSATYSGGAGTSESPFILETAQDLAQLSVNVAPSSTYSSGKYFRLDADINLSGKLWTPIAANPNGYQNAFNGHFDGNGHVIIGVTVDDSEDETKYHMIGFFGWAYNAEIHDLGLENVSINSSGMEDGTYAGTFVGFADDTTVTNCYATGSVNGTGAARAGGFVGQLYNDTIGNCFFSGSVAGDGSMVGGFVAYRRGTIQNCWCAASTAGAGFEASSSGSGTITNCYYDKTLNPSGTDSAGHWVGKTTGEIKSSDMVNALNGSQSPAPWKRDASGQINAGYPVLSWVDIPPVLVGSSVWRSNGTTATVRFMSDKAGTCWYQITGSATPPVDIVTGGTSGGAVTAGAAASVALSGLTPGAKYVHLAVVDGAGNVSATLTVAMPYDYYYYDGFEADSPASVPAGWNKMYPNPGVAQVSSTTAASGIHSFLLDGYTLNASAYYWLLGSVPDSLVVEADICPASSGDEAGGISLWKTKNGTDYWMASVLFEYGSIYTQNGTGDTVRHELGTYSVDTWYHVAILHDFINHTYNVYINGELKSTGLGIYGGSGPTRAILSSGNDADGCACYFDNVKLYEMPRTAVTFNENHGTTPAERTYYIASGTSAFYDAVTGGSEQTLTVPTRPGYTFGGWYKEAGCIAQIIDASLAICAGTDYADASANWTKAENVTLYAKWLEMTPTELGLDYENELITGLTGNADYSISGVNVTAGADGKTAIQSGWFGTSLSVVKKGAAASSSFDSAAAALTVPARPSAPTGLAAVDETYPNAGDGKITGAADTMAYKLSTASDWTAVASGATEITGLDDGTYYVRYHAATSGSPAFVSAYFTVTVGTTGATPETQPAAVTNYPNEKLTGLTVGSEYDIGGSAYTADGSGEISISNDWFGTTISIVKKGNGTTTTNSTAQSLPLAARPVAPTTSAFTVTQPSANVSTGTIAGITAAMEYSTDGGTSWTVGTNNTVSGLTAGNVLIRIKATDTAPKSGSLTVTITAYQAPSGGETPAWGGGTQTKTERVRIISADGSTTATGTVTSVGNGLSVTVPSGEINRLAGSGQRVRLETDTVTVGFDAAAMKHIDSAAGSNDVMLEIVRVDASSLSDADRQLVGDRPVYDFSLTAGENKIFDFGGGKAEISIPYTLGSGEDPNAVVVYYIDGSGDLTTVTGTYSAETGMVEFVAEHFSVYAVGYNYVSFDDVTDTAWYYNAVTFCAAREITDGTGDNNFSPDVTLTRGQFIVLLMRAYGIEPEDNPASNFSDAGDTYYTGYLASAKQMGFSNGVGGNRYAPEQTITRQEMFTLLYRTLEVLGQLPNETSGKTLSDFSDVGSIDFWAKDAVTFFVGTGTISGSCGKLLPVDTANRAEMAQILYNLLSA